MRFAGEDYTGMLAGIYTVQSAAVLVLTPIGGGGAEFHIPLAGAVVTVGAESTRK